MWRCIIIACLLLLTAPVCRAGDDASAVKGRILQQDGTPLRGVTVELREREDLGGPSAESFVTEADGNFSLQFDRPGKYLLKVSRSGWVVVEIGGRRTSQDCLWIEARTGRGLAPITIKMTRAPAIEGRVLDDEGEGLAGVTVQAVPADSDFLRAANLPYDMTDDAGRFRIGDLAPGDYHIIAVVTQAAPMRLSDQQRGVRTRGAPVFYPGTTHRSTGSTLSLKAGETQEIEMQITRVPVVSVKGRVYPENGEVQVDQTEISLSFGGHEIAETHANEDGNFELTDIPPGSYYLEISPSGNYHGTYWMALDVPEGGIGGLVAGVPGDGTIDGRVVLDGMTQAPHYIAVVLEAADSGDPAAQRIYLSHYRSITQGVQQDGSFTMSDVPTGKYWFHLFDPSQALAGYYLSAAFVDGKRLTSSTIEINGGSRSVNLVMRPGVTIRGRVADARAVGGVVVAVPRERDRKDLYRLLQADQDGYFELHGLAPTEYAIYAFDDFSYDDRLDDVLLAQFDELATRIDVTRASGLVDVSMIEFDRHRTYAAMR